MIPDEPPPLPPQEPPPLPRRKRHRPHALLAVPAAALLALYMGPLRVEVTFVDDAGRVPGPFEVTLRSGDTEKKTTAEDGRLHLLRGRWHELEVTDLSYVRSSRPISGGKMNVIIERNTLLKLKQAAIGTPSVPQRGDPDPKLDR
jgi:hypothetical protein